MWNQTRSVVVSPGMKDVADGAAQKQQTPDERRWRAVHCTAQSSEPRGDVGAAAHDEKSWAQEQQGGTPGQWRARSRGRRRSARWFMAGVSKESEGGKGAVHGWESPTRTALMPV
ncbi:hypothetical protein Zm00014a_012148 [Zea mays]|uniref:Uncharacterized protein n=1 Tax=Zea mays TaxID=4577 RepID=A0A3L6EBT9_MAIZE|nr:hypothetical protein Zm00014a_012148 [Zea mays]